MTTPTTTLRRDGNFTPLQSDLGLVESKSITYATATTGATGATTLFTVTGDVLVRVFAICSTLLTSSGGGTLEVGIAGNTASLIAQTTGTDIDAGEVWIDNAPATIEALPSAYILTNGTDIIQTIATGAIDTGVIKYYCMWFPLSSDGDVVAA